VRANPLILLSSVLCLLSSVLCARNRDLLQAHLILEGGENLAVYRRVLVNKSSLRLRLKSSPRPPAIRVWSHSPPCSGGGKRAHSLGTAS
jgi:hypothetical protein